MFDGVQICSISLSDLKKRVKTMNINLFFISVEGFQ